MNSDMGSGTLSALPAKPTPATPTRKESRRRSWFGLVTPTRTKERPAAAAVAASTLGPTPADDFEEVLDATPTAARRSSGTWSGSGNESTFPRSSSSSSGSIALAMPPPVVDLTDASSDPNATIKKNRAQPPQTPNNDSDTQPTRKKEFTKLPILSRSSSKSRPSSRQGFTSRVFSRTAGRSVSPDQQMTPPGIGAVLSPSKVPRRTSSTRPLGATSTADAPVLFSRTPNEALSNNKTLPPTPDQTSLPPLTFPPGTILHDRDRSLPSLPSDDDSSLSSHAKRDVPPLGPRPPRDMSHDSLGGLPRIPTDIVVTPSSPLESDPFDSVFIDPQAATERGRIGSAPVSRSSSTRPHPRAESPSPQPGSRALGIGYPMRSATTSPGPKTQQSVSMPLPERPSSPVPKVTFTEAADGKSHVKEKESSIKQPRPRSFSAIFTRSPLVSSEVATDDDAQGSSMFNWLNVRKTIKRRRSEGKLGSKARQEAGMSDSEGNKAPVFPAANQRANVSTPVLGSGDEATVPQPAIPPAPASPTSRGPLSTRRPRTAPARQAFSASLAPSTLVLPKVESTEQLFWPQTWVDNPAGSESPGHPLDSNSDNVGVRSSRPILEPTPWPRPPIPPTSPLSALPEAGVPPSITEIVYDEPYPPPVMQTGRGRSLSDATQRQLQRAPPDLITPASTSSSPRMAFASPDIPPSPGPRPTISTRTSSSSIVLGKVRSVFVTKRGRPRSNSALRYGPTTDEHDREDSLDTPQTRPESSASSSFVASPALPPVRIRPDDVPQVSTLALQCLTGGEDDRKVVLNETSERSPRSSYAASSHSHSRSNRRSTTEANQGFPPSAAQRSRARASTIGSGNVSGQGTFGGFNASGTYLGGSTTSLHGSNTYLHDPLFPTSSTPPRPRTGSIRRLSTGIFRNQAMSPTKPSSGSLFPLPPRTNGSSPGQSGDDLPGGSNTRPPSRTAAFPLNGQVATGDKEDLVEDKARLKELEAKDSEDADSWLNRLSTVSRRELAALLSSSADQLHTDALKIYMNRFDFNHMALDVALRRLLMHMSLPKETQQIDRVIAGFASRYDDCETGLFGDKDNAYVLAFSMMMLHTDAFNRHNKSKMTKADYVKNTRLPGVPPSVLEAFYDNITFTPFVFIEDDDEAAAALNGISHGPATGADRHGKIDVYDMIVGGQLGTLRADVERYIPADSPFSCMGTSPFLDIDGMQRSFANASPLQFFKSKAKRRSSLNGTPAGDRNSIFTSKLEDEVVTLKIVKVGLISRKEDTPAPQGKKAPSGRKWKSWSVILTGSQLLFFKDTMLALTIIEKLNAVGNGGDSSLAPYMTGFKPDDVLGLSDCVAIFDRDGDNLDPECTFRLVIPGGRHFIMQADNERSMNEWLTLINYASTFRTAGIRMRPPGLNSQDAVQAGAAAADSHRRDLETGSIKSENSHIKAVVFADRPMVDEPIGLANPRPKLRRVGSLRSSPAPAVDITGANEMVVGEGEHMRAVIGSVKAELAAGRGQSIRAQSLPQVAVDGPTTNSTRSVAVKRQVEELKRKAGPIEKSLSDNLRIARNLALLTPFQKSTRDRIESYLPELGASIRSERIELAKLHLWITLLLKDQDRDQRDWARVRHVALQAAAQTLRQPASRTDRRATIGGPVAIPRLALPSNDDLSPGHIFGMSPAESPLSIHPSEEEEGTASRDSRINSSRRTSASDDMSRQSSSEYLSASEYLNVTDAFDEDLERASISPSPEPLGARSATPVGSNGRTTPAYDEAEHWRHTRAATKVSLAKMPRGSQLPDLGKLSSMLKKSQVRSNSSDSIHDSLAILTSGRDRSRSTGLVPGPSPRRLSPAAVSARKGGPGWI